MDRNLRLLTLGIAVRMLGNAIYAPFLALFLLNVLKIPYIEIGTIIVGVGIVQLPFNYLGGLFTDRLGRRNLIILGLAAEAAATAGLAYSFALRSLAGAIASALVGGCVTSAAGAAFFAYIADFAAGHERTKGFTWFRIGFNAGYSAGVTLGGTLIAAYGFATAVAVGAGIVAVCTVLLAFTLAASPYDLELAKGQEGSAPPRDSPASVPRRGLRESFRILVRDRVALEVLVAVALAALVVGQWAVTFPLFVHEVLGISYAWLGIGLALNGLVVVLGQAPTTEALTGRRHTSIAIGGILLYVVAFLGLGAAGLTGFLPLAVFIAAVVVITLGENLITIPQSTLPSNMAPAQEVGSYNGAFQTVGGIGFLAAVFLGTAVLSAISDPLLIWLILVAPALLAILLFRDSAGRLADQVNRAWNR